MKTEHCAVCGCEDKKVLVNHHVMPRVMGGSDDETNLLTVCNICHGKLHGKFEDKEWSNEHNELIKEGMKKAKERGSKFGRSSPNYVATERVKRHEKKVSEKCKADSEEQAKAVEAAINDQPEGLILLVTICRTLESLGILTVTGKSKWDTNTVKNLIMQHGLDKNRFKKSQYWK